MSNKMSEKTWRRILEVLEVDENKIQRVIEIIDNTSEESLNATSKKSLYTEVTNVLRRLGISAHLSGFTYLRAAIMRCVEEEEEGKIYRGYTTKLYPQIANQFKTIPSSVERSIGYAIEAAWLKGDIEYQNEVFGNRKRETPTNSEFIATISDKIRGER